jgi:RNA-directed DNA polymerase
MPSSTIHGLPLIRSFADLAHHLGCEAWHLHRVLYGRPAEYALFRLRKKAGGYRTIATPSPVLKRMQRWVLRSILDALHVPPCSFGFARGDRLRDHAEQHRHALAILGLDIEGFFPSISVAQVVRVFVAAGYPPRAAATLAQLCTHLGALPQGAPTSPKLATLVCYRMDRRLSRLAATNGLTYTRYADDLTFSSRSTPALARARPLISRIVRECGFRLNSKKTRLVGGRRALTVTGLIVGPDKVGIGRKRLRELRARLHKARASASPEEVGALQGWLDYVRDVDPARYSMLTRYIRGLIRGDAPALQLLRLG